MAKSTYQDVTSNNPGNGDYKVGFFNIANGEEAIVRFAIDSMDDFELYTVHPIIVGQSSYPNRRVSCLRNNPKTDPMQLCPLCAKGEKVQQRMYIKMLQYVNDNGRIIPKAVVWDRPAYSYAPQIKSYLDNYGPLSNIVCKIVRHGDGLETKYDIIPNLNPQIYNEQLYPKDFSDFADFNVLGGMIMDRTFEEITQFIQTGQFPQRDMNNVKASNMMPANNIPQTPPMYVEPQNMNTPMQQVPMQPAYTPTTETPTPLTRPVRYY